MIRWIAALLVTVVVVGYNACGPARDSKGTTTGNPLVVLGSKPFTPLSTAFGFRGCLTGVIGIPVNSGNVMMVGPVVLDISPAGFTMGQLSVNQDNYTQMVLIFEAGSCSGFAGALEVTNDNGTFTYNSTITLIFNSVVPMVRNEDWWVHFDNWAAALAAVNSSADIANLANQSGTCNP